MTYLLDINLLIALSDPHHVHHDTAHLWFGKTGGKSWATCPLTENGFIRIIGNPAYPNSPGSSASALDFLHHLCSRSGHHFWPDDLSLRQKGIWRDRENILSSQITDCYLLALSVRHDGKLATFDRRIPAHLFSRGTECLHLIV